VVSLEELQRIDLSEPEAMLAFRFGVMLGREAAEQGIAFHPLTMATSMYAAAHGRLDALTPPEQHHYTQQMHHRANPASWKPSRLRPASFDLAYVPDFEDHEGLYGYLLGRQAVGRLHRFEIPERWDALAAGLFVGGGVLPLTLSEVEIAVATERLQEHIDAVMKRQIAARRRHGEALVASFAASEGVVEWPSGAWAVIHEVGAGDQPDADDAVMLHYEATQADGRWFETVDETDVGIQMPVPTLMPGLRDLVLRYPVGTRATLVLPPAAHGFDAGQPTPLAHTTLRYDVEVAKLIRYPEFYDQLKTGAQGGAADEIPPPFLRPPGADPE